jgi:signal transduction histidine kinase
MPRDGADVRAPAVASSSDRDAQSSEERHQEGRAEDCLAGGGEMGALMLDPAGAEIGPVPFVPEARVLLADDNADMRAYVRRILGTRWSVEAAADGVAALAAARRSPPDLVVADVMMPGLDGFALLRALRAEPATRGVPVILLSARAGEEARVEGLEAGADDYLVKPFSARELVARVATHLQVALLRRAAERERAQMYAVFEQAPVALSVLRGPDHVYELANPIYRAMVGRKSLVGLRFLEALPELTGSPIAALLDRVYETGEPFCTDEYRADIDRGRGVVEESYWRFNLQPVRDPSGEVTRLLNVVVDVTEQVRARKLLEAAAREREDLLRRAEEANQAKDGFLAMLGHELRNPLAPIVTALHLMRLRAGGAADRERLVIERQVEHLTALVDDLLDVSRITQGKIVLKRQRVEIAEVVAKAIEQASPLLELRGHHLGVAVPARGLAVDGDVTRLAQVVSNLLTNAAKYTERGGNVTIVAERRDGDVVLRVRDDGAGIAAEMLPKIFDLFMQAPQTIDRAQGGLGLGLAIVKSLVALHGGSVSAHSEGRGRGCEITVRIPAATQAAPDAGVEEARSPEETRAAPRARLRILVVDDNLDAAVLLAESLDDLGDVRVAHDGPSALQIAETFAPEVALLDLGLPVMDGYELARRLRAAARGAPVRLIAITGYGQEADFGRTKEAGFDAHLVKPVQLERVRALLASIADATAPSPPA